MSAPLRAMEHGTTFEKSSVWGSSVVDLLFRKKNKVLGIGAFFCRVTLKKIKKGIKCSVFGRSVLDLLTKGLCIVALYSRPIYIYS